MTLTNPSPADSRPSGRERYSVECRCGARWSGTRLEHCAACHETFSGTTAGDIHRVGPHDVGRRCLTADELISDPRLRPENNRFGTRVWKHAKHNPWAAVAK